MLRSLLAGLIGAFALSITMSSRADEVVGAIWEVQRQDNKEIVWRFRAGPKGVVWTVPKEGKPESIGTWGGNPGKTVINIDAPDKGKIGAKRTITIVLVEKNPLKWQGEVEFPNGDKKPLTVKLIKD